MRWKLVLQVTGLESHGMFLTLKGIESVAFRIGYSPTSKRELGIENRSSVTAGGRRCARRSNEYNRKSHAVTEPIVFKCCS